MLNITKTHTWTKKQIIKITLLVSVLAASGWSFAVSPTAQAASCPTPKNNYGSLTLPVKVQQDGEYVIWTRMAVGSTSNNTIDLQVDSSDCFSIGGSNIPPGAWKWVNYANGSEDSVVKVNLTAGSHKLKFVATKPNILVDRVIVTPDGGCEPTDKGDNCPAGDAQGPDVNVAAPKGNRNNGSVDIDVDANDKSGVKEVQLVIDGVVRSVDDTEPYDFDWDSKSAGDGVHTIVVRAIDNSGNATLTKGITIRVNGGGSYKKGDVNSDGSVNVKDMSVLLSNWGKNATTSGGKGDTNGDKAVNAQDLSAIFSDWGK